MKRVLIAVLVLLTGCGTPRLVQEEGARQAAVGPVSSTHYRAFADADALAAAFRWSPSVQPMVSAHRGGPGPGLPENALASFDHALNYAPALIECDVRVAGDGTLVLLHDETLDRTTTGTGPLEDLPLSALRSLRLVDPDGLVTPFRMPTLDEALAWAEDRAVLLLDIKDGVTPDELVRAVRDADAENRVIVIVYTLDDLLTYFRLAPELVYSATTETTAEVEALLAAPVAHDRLLAFTGVGSANPAVLDRLHAAGIRAQLGTFGATDTAAGTDNPAAYYPFLEAGVDVLATDNVPTAARALHTVRGR